MSTTLDIKDGRVTVACVRCRMSLVQSDSAPIAMECRYEEDDAVVEESGVTLMGTPYWHLRHDRYEELPDQPNTAEMYGDCDDSYTLVLRVVGWTDQRPRMVAALRAMVHQRASEVLASMSKATRRAARNADRLRVGRAPE